MRERGFTLIEVLVAFVIFTLVAGSLYRALSTGLGHERIADGAVTRLLEARSLLDRFGAGTPLREGEFAGELASGDRWTMAVRRHGPPASPDGPWIALYDLRLRVEGGDGRALELHALRPGA